MSQRFTDITAVDTLRVCTSADPTAYVDLVCPEAGVLQLTGQLTVMHIDDADISVGLSCNESGFLTTSGLLLENMVDPGSLTDSSAIFACDTSGVLGSGVSSIAFRTEESLLTGSYTANRAIPAVINDTNVLILCQFNEAT